MKEAIAILLLIIPFYLSGQEIENVIISKNQDYNCDSLYQMKDSIVEMGFLFETLPSIKGGWDTITYLLEFPEEYLNSEIIGNVYGDVMISKDGNLKCYKLFSDLPLPFLKEAEKVLKTLEITPATYRGRTIQYELLIPFRFIDPKERDIMK